MTVIIITDNNTAVHRSNQAYNIKALI